MGTFHGANIGAGYVGHFDTLAQLTAKCPVATFAGRAATIEVTTGQAQEYFCDGNSWAAVVQNAATVGALGGPATGKALAALNLAAFRPVDLVMIGDSHQNMDGYGYNDAFENALAKRFGMYATPLYSQEIAGTSYSNCGHASSGFPSGVGATAGAPAGQAPFALALRSYYASGFFYLSMPSHPVNQTPDDANLISYRAAILRWAYGTPDASVIDLGALLTNTDIINNGG